jgi:hypothetical protein
LGCNISYKGEKDLNMKITNIKIVGITNQIFKPSLFPDIPEYEFIKLLPDQHYLKEVKHA